MAEIVMYLRDWCPFCHRARHLLDAKGVAYHEVDVEREPERAAEMVGRAGGRRTVPQIFIGERHIGGYDDMAALDRRGELDRLLDETAATTGE